MANKIGKYGNYANFLVNKSGDPHPEYCDKEVDFDAIDDNQLILDSFIEMCDKLVEVRKSVLVHTVYGGEYDGSKHDLTHYELSNVFFRQAIEANQVLKDCMDHWLKKTSDYEATQDILEIEAQGGFQNLYSSYREVRKEYPETSYFSY